MTARRDLTGSRFGRLTVIEYSHTKKGVARWSCQCDCGSPRKAIRSWDLLSGRTNSCRCLANELTRQRKGKPAPSRVKHGMSGTPEYYSWYSMIRRCTQPSNPQWHRYGGRGITVCDRWLGEDGVLNFIGDMGRMPAKKYSIERDDVDGNYCPENCRWIPRSRQAYNKSTSKKYTYEGRTMCVSEWAREKHIDDATLRARLKKGLSFPDAISRPLQPRVKLIPTNCE